MKSSLERFNPSTQEEKTIFGAEVLRFHFERYRYAGQHIKGGTIGDIACGTGYGSNILIKEFPEKITRILAVDSDYETIQYAKKNYTHPLIEFQLQDAQTIQPAASFDSVVSFETLEHLERPADFVQRISKHIVKGGKFIVSVPITPSMDANPYHLHDFTSKKLNKICESGNLFLKNYFIQQQKYNPFLLTSKSNHRTDELRKNIASYYFNHPGKFLLRLKSIITDGFKNKYYVAVFEKG